MTWALLGVVAMQLATISYLVMRPNLDASRATKAQEAANALQKKLDEANTAMLAAMEEARTRVEEGQQRIEGLEDEQQLLIAGLEEEKRNHRADKELTKTLEKQRDDLLAAIRQGGAEPAAVALLIRNELRRLQQKASTPRVPDPTPTKGGRG